MIKISLDDIPAPNLITLQGQELQKILESGENTFRYIFAVDRHRFAEEQRRNQAQATGGSFFPDSISVPDKVYREAMRNPNPGTGGHPLVGNAYMNLSQSIPLWHNVPTHFTWNRVTVLNQPNPERIERGIELSNIIFDEGVSLVNIHSDQFFELRNCQVSNALHLSNVLFTSLKIVDCNIKEIIIDNSQIGELVITGDVERVSLGKKEWNNLLPSGISSIEIAGAISGIELSGVNTQVCNLRDLSKTDNVDISGAIVNLSVRPYQDEENSFYLPEKTGKIVIENLHYVLPDNIDINAIIKNVSLSEGYLSGVNRKDGHIMFQDFENCSKLEFVDFTNSGELFLENIKVRSKFELKNSSLGKAQLFNLNFNKNCIIKIEKTNIIDISLLKSSFPLGIKTGSRPDYHEQKEVYRQLKYMSYKQGNRVEEMRYEMLEMRAFTTMTLDEGGLGDKIILLTNWTNNHGQDWLRAFILWVFVSAFFYTCVNRATGHIYIDIQKFPETVESFLSFSVNPIHRFDDVFPERSMFKWAKLADTIAKVFSAYFLYQILRAFRKYFK